ncbi:hypothetical protein CYMTET_35249, partial [Cymbomonas tetramitiformis]
MSVQTLVPLFILGLLGGFYFGKFDFQAPILKVQWTRPPPPGETNLAEAASASSSEPGGDPSQDPPLVPSSALQTHPTLPVTQPTPASAHVTLPSSANTSTPTSAPPTPRTQDTDQVHRRIIITTPSPSASPTVPESQVSTSAPPVSLSQVSTKCEPPCNGTCNEELGRCDRGYQETCKGSKDRLCYDTRTGKLDLKFEAFSNAYSMFCFGNCSARGKCERGFCHCDMGYWGADCGISRAADSSLLLHERPPLPGNDVPRPRVYVYDLPPKFMVKPRIVGLVHNKGALNFAFAERILRSAHRTLDPENADLFYAPGMGNYNDVKGIPAYIQATWPDLIGESGARHLWPSTDQDWGIFMGPPGEYYTKDGEIPGNLKDSIFMDYRGFFFRETELQNSSFRPDQDIRIPPPVVLGHSPHQYMPMDGSRSPRMLDFLTKCRQSWAKRLEQTVAEIAASPLLFFAGAMAPLCGRNKAVDRNCYNSSNSRAWAYNLFNRPYVAYEPE